MTIAYAPMAGVLAAIFTYVSLGVFGIDGGPLAVAVWTGVTLLWEASPLPNSNGGMAARSKRGQYWGFKSPEKEDENQ